MLDASITNDPRYIAAQQDWRNRLNLAQQSVDQATAQLNAAQAAMNGAASKGDLFGMIRAQATIASARNAVNAAMASMAALTAQSNTALADLGADLQALQSGDAMLKKVSDAAANAIKRVEGMDVLMAMATVYRAAMDNSADKLKELTDEIQQANADLAAVTALAAEVRNARPTGDANSTAKLSAAVVDKLKSYGIPLPDLGSPDNNGVYTIKQSTFDVLGENIKGVSDTMTTRQSLLLQQIQKASNEYQERSDTSTGLMKSDKDLVSGINRNL